MIMRTIILNSIQVYTSLFLIFAAVSFLYSAYRNRVKRSEIIGNMICGLTMISALFFIWR